MNEQSSTLTQSALPVPPLPKLNEIAMTFWQDLLLGVIHPSKAGGPVNPSVGDKGGGWR